MIKILPPDLLGVSHRIPWKNINTVYCLQISALDPEIFVSKICNICKWHNWWCHILNPILNEAHQESYHGQFASQTIETWQVLKGHTNSYKNSIPMATHLFPVSTYFCDTLLCHKLKLTYSCWIMHTRYYLQISKWNTKGGWKAT